MMGGPWVLTPGAYRRRGASWRFPWGCVSRGCSSRERWRWPPRPSPGTGGTRRTRETEAAGSSPPVRRATPPRDAGSHPRPLPRRPARHPTATRTPRTSPTAHAGSEVPAPPPLLRLRLRRATGFSRALRGYHPAPTRPTPTALRTRPAPTTGSAPPPSAGPSSTASRPRRRIPSGGCCAGWPPPVFPCRARAAAAGRRRPRSTPPSPGGRTPARGVPRTPSSAGCWTSTGGTPPRPCGSGPPPAPHPPAPIDWPVSTRAVTARRGPARPSPSS